MHHYKKILVLAPHIDDAEFGCGGTLDRLIKQGSNVIYLAFSDCRESLDKSHNEDKLREELRKSTEILGIDRVEILDFKVRYFHERRQEILQKLIDIRNDFKPDLIFTPSREDIHQDHQVICNESIRAFKHSTIFGYELPWNCFNLSSEVLITLSEENIKQKIKAIGKYESQKHRLYHNESYLRSLASTTGLRINKKYAEAFELVRLIY